MQYHHRDISPFDYKRDPVRDEHGNTVIKVRLFFATLVIGLRFFVVFLSPSTQITWMILSAKTKSYFTTIFSSNPTLFKLLVKATFLNKLRLNYLPSNLAKAAKLLTCVRHVFGTNLGQDKDYLHLGFPWVSSDPSGKCGERNLIRLQLLLPTFFPIHYSLLIGYSTLSGLYY
jgi:hypothetical protein